mgnify:CR=1 FL=1
MRDIRKFLDRQRVELAAEKNGRPRLGALKDHRDAMAAKAGQVVSGFSKVEGALGQGQVEALIHASDGAADGIRKLDAIARQNAGINDDSRKFPVVTALTSEQLDLALGRSNVVHAALLAGPASKTFLSRSQILVRYRMADDDEMAGAAKNSV